MKDWVKRSPVLDAFDETTFGDETGRGCFFGGGSSQPAGQTTTVQKSDPWSGQQPYLTDVFSQAQNLDQTYTPQYYPGSTVAPLTDPQLQAIQAAATMGANGTPVSNAANATTANIIGGANLYANPAYGMLSPIATGAGSTLGATAASYLKPIATGTAQSANPASGALNAFTNGAFLSADNPYFQSAADALQAQVEPGLMATFNQGNQYLSGLGLQSQAGQGITGALGSGLGLQSGAAGDIGSLFGQGLSNQMQALAPQIQGMDYQNVAALSDAGAQLQNQTQQQINDAVARFNFQQQLPYAQLANYSNLVQGGYGNTSTLTQPYFQNQSANVLGGALGGGMLGNLLSGGSGTGMAGGAGLGALLAFL